MPQALKTLFHSIAIHIRCLGPQKSHRTWFFCHIYQQYFPHVFPEEPLLGHGIALFRFYGKCYISFKHQVLGEGQYECVEDHFIFFPKMYLNFKYLDFYFYEINKKCLLLHFLKFNLKFSITIYTLHALFHLHPFPPPHTHNHHTVVHVRFLKIRESLPVFPNLKWYLIYLKHFQNHLLDQINLNTANRPFCFLADQQ